MLPTNPWLVGMRGSGLPRRKHWPRPSWPGPLTLVVPKTAAIVRQVSAGLATVGLRAPAHPLAQQLLRLFDGPVAAPSANRSNGISPTTAQHVQKDLGSAVDLILDGGPCQVGIESTIIDISGERPIILRPGAISREEIEQHIGKVELLAEPLEPGSAARSPGQHARHYAPTSPAFGFNRSQIGTVIQWLSQHALGLAVVMLLEDETHEALRKLVSQRLTIKRMPHQPTAYAQCLYTMLRAADELSPTAIWIEIPPDTASWTAVRDRLRPATVEH